MENQISVFLGKFINKQTLFAKENICIFEEIVS